MTTQTDITYVRGACPHDCPDTCATITEVQDGHAIRFYADKEHPITKGWLCAKVRPYLERVYDPHRLTYPVRRVGPKGSGQWERISWDAAIDEITTRWKRIIAEHSAAAILPYSYSGTLGLLQLAVCNTRLWNRMGASGLERAICGAAAEAATEATLGARWSPDPTDVLHSNLVLIWGHNPASTNPHFMPLLREAQKQGTHVIVIDPRRTLTARSANEHIQPRPATDGALALGMLHVIFSEALHDEPWLEANSVGWRELHDRALQYPPTRVAEITSLSEATIIDLARRYATTKPALLKTADGIQRHGNGGQTFRALCCLPAVVGQIGVRGGGLFYSTSGYVKWNAGAVGHATECPPIPRIVNMNRLGAALTGEVQGPPIMSLFVFCANPVTSTPNAGLIVKGMQREDLFTVVHELFMTDTAQYADIVLPATSQLEHVDLHKAYGHRYLQYNHAAIPAPGEAKSNWDVMRLLAQGMGYDEPWLQESAEDVLRGILDTTRTNNPHLQGVTLERLQAEGTVPLFFSPEQEIPFADGHFPTPSGKVELRCDALAQNGFDPLPSYTSPLEFQQHTNGYNDTLMLISGASHHFVSSSMANQPSLMAREGQPFVEINPADAAARGITHGDKVVVENTRGWCELQAMVTDDVPPGVAVAPKGPWAQHTTAQRNINWTTPDTLADLAGQSTFHSNIVQIRRAL
ncbi:MAG: molybdopterin oxidoreductase family protein [Chloroflexi bacterium AL-W]|nr:molybdopterin oxidoreductase family protein [Chloroflexi bacterium AL-N1]NOK65962.1 molybdopterin oxidoreductase family protein [Chloroflexi bacterium AL-N10]NOK72843.1 molybdopterin oxidoreductase family protein [Chloroflexi bacterium AL-N5]NOK79740.1 molybdopterin oxidoreductase family protein [Chloroflexi bacterium AL-W]NOK88404.1 molybdopterin oxidoreductase family protein [Chloroflexi bacterium AL-N15]